MVAFNLYSLSQSLLSQTWIYLFCNNSSGLKEVALVESATEHSRELGLVIVDNVSILFSLIDKRVRALPAFFDEEIHEVPIGFNWI